MLSVYSKTAIGVAKQGKIEDVRILTSNPGEEELTSIKSKIFGSLDALFHGQWTGFDSTLDQGEHTRILKEKAMTDTRQ